MSQPAIRVIASRVARRGATLCLLVVASCALDDARPDELDGHEAAIVGGSLVTGAGPDQRWQGIVRLETESGGCSGTFISTWHILTAAHCFDDDGSQTVFYSAPGLGRTERTAEVSIPACWWNGGTRSCDLAVVELSVESTWAKGSRRKLYLYGGSTSVGTALHPYGYGYENYEGGGGGVLRGGANRAVFTITDHEDGYFEGVVGAVRPCDGDSGGPATVERDDDASFRPVIWGIYSASELGGRETCAERDEIMWWTKTTTNLAWIESVLGYRCTAVAGVSGAVRCW